MRALEGNPEDIAAAIGIPGHMAERMVVGRLEPKELFSYLNQPRETQETPAQQQAAIDYLYRYPEQAGEVVTLTKHAVGGKILEVFDRTDVGWYTAIDLITPDHAHHKSSVLRGDTRRDSLYRSRVNLLAHLYRVEPPEEELPHTFAKKRLAKLIREKVPLGDEETIVYESFRDKVSRNPVYTGTVRVEVGGTIWKSFTMREKSALVAERAAAEDLLSQIKPDRVDRAARVRRKIVTLSASGTQNYKERRSDAAHRRRKK